MDPESMLDIRGQIYFCAVGTMGRTYHLLWVSVSENRPLCVPVHMHTCTHMHTNAYTQHMHKHTYIHKAAGADKQDCPGALNKKNILYLKKYLILK